jgi:pimeloyl-ACP methyl ester carboxylesterase
LWAKSKTVGHKKTKNRIGSYFRKKAIFAANATTDQMKENLIIEGKFKYVEIGGGTPIVILHGLMGGLSNFQGVTEYFPNIITGSSGLYESAMGDGYPRRGDYEFIKKKAEDVFYDPAIATKEIVDEVFATVNDRNKIIKTLAIAKSAIRHNMANDLPKMNTPTCIIWGKNDTVTPPDVADLFHELLPDSDLFWIEKCGHAAMMEHPDEFNDLMGAWLEKRNF